MKISASVEIGKPPSEVFRFITDFENMSLWMSNFLRVESISGEPDEMGGRLKYYFLESSRTVEMDAEIINKIGDSLITTYLKNESLDILVENTFQQIAKNHTVYTQNMEFIPNTLAARAWLLFYGNKLSLRQREDLELLREAMEALSDYEVE
jgi:uncharacterized membrane protein